MNASGFMVTDKAPGITSHDFLRDTARAVSGSLGVPKLKAGHAGTLDSFATGVLICLFGSYTRLSDFFMCSDKVYEAELMFGEETDTLDPLGTVIARGAVPSLQNIEALIPSFVGTINQVPPVYSAVHIQGKRAYERALHGEAVEPEARPVTVHALTLLSYTEPYARIRASVSKGTYIRSLARDMGRALGSCARLSALRRISSGPFTVDEALSPESAELRLLDSAQAAALGLGTVMLEAHEARSFLSGLPLYKLPPFAGASSPAAVFDAHGLLGIAEKKDKAWRYACVLGDRR